LSKGFKKLGYFKKFDRSIKFIYEWRKRLKIKQKKRVKK